jgi:lipid II:glycine glycyltransferase (peptidoglycan interpeptide bridge formation enzyme)
LDYIELSERLYEDEGYHYITNLDFSGAVTEMMRERNQHLEEMDYVEMDLS